MLETTKQLLEVLEESEISKTVESDGIIVDVIKARRISEILALSNTHNFKGHVKVFDVTNASVKEEGYIQFERRTSELFTGSFNIKLDNFEKITFFISHGEWYDMIFDFKNGLGYAILTCVPKD